MKNQELCNYCQEVVNIELFIYEQRRFRDILKHQIEVLNQVPYEPYISTEPEEYPLFFDKVMKFSKLLVFTCFMIIYYLFAKNIGCSIGSKCFFIIDKGLSDGWDFLGSWWNDTPYFCAVCFIILLIMISFIIGLLLRFWPISLVLVGVPLSYFSSKIICKLGYSPLIKEKKAEYKKSYIKHASDANSKIKIRNETLTQQYQMKRNLMVKEKALVSKTILSAKTTLQQFYDQDIIYDKYRNLFAMSCILEYIKSGICDGLEGPYGAYKTYKDDYYKYTVVKMLEQGLSKLDNVLDKLDNIIDEQSELGQAIENINNRINRFDNQLNYLSSNMDNVLVNTEIASYNVEATKRLSSFSVALSLYDHMTIKN